MSHPGELSREDVIREIAPTGRLRVSINYGNPILAQRNGDSGTLTGVSVQLARALAEQLDVGLILVPFDTAGKAFNAIKGGECDFGFLAIDAERARVLDYTQPYVDIEGGYLVRSNSPYLHYSDVDRRGVRIAACQNTAYDLFLRRSLKHAQLVYAPTSAAAVELFLNGETDVASGISSYLQRFASIDPKLSLAAGEFMHIKQAVALPKGKALGCSYLDRFIADMKASGFVRRALDETGQALIPVSR